MRPIQQKRKSSSVTFQRKLPLCDILQVHLLFKELPLLPVRAHLHGALWGGKFLQLITKLGDGRMGKLQASFPRKGIDGFFMAVSLSDSAEDRVGQLCFLEGPVLCNPAISTCQASLAFCLFKFSQHCFAPSTLNRGLPALGFQDASNWRVGVF